MGKIVGGVNGFDEIEVDEDEFIADKVVELQDAIMSSYTVYRNKKNIESDKIIAPRKKREEHIEPIINVKKIYKKKREKEIV